MKTPNFVHLNVHSHYSILNGCSTIQQIVDSAIKNRMPGIAITDYGNMFGVMEFFDYVSRINNERRQKGKKPFKPIIGCELYVAPEAKEDKKLCKHCKGYCLTVLAKNYQGYKNLIKIVSNSWTDGYYMRPRTDHHDLEKYHEGLIVLSGGVGSEVYSHVVSDDIAGLDATIKWYKQTFGVDYYLELQRCADSFLTCNTPSDLMLEQQKVNAVLMQKAKEYGVKVVATNDVHYVDPTDAEAYKVQLCAAAGKTIDELSSQMPVTTCWLRGRKEMCELYVDVPEAIASTVEIFDNVEFYDIRHAPIVPTINIPDGFGNDRSEREDNYLEYLSFSKAKQIYGESLPEDVSDRLKFELQIIKQRRVSGYFLFLQDVINTAQSELGVWVGPGRGSAAGSLVCYCLSITKIDPLKHDLLFERFLSPGGTMFLDIDIDFDDEGRERVLEWLQQKNGKDCCAHVVSFYNYCAATAFSAVARAYQMPVLRRASIYHSLIDEPWLSIKDAIKHYPLIEKRIHEYGLPLRDISTLEQKAWGFGVHACGFVIADEPVSNWAPVSTCSIEDSKGKEQIVNCTQYDGWHVEPSGLIKFDFLGLKTLSQMRDLCESIRVHYDKDFDIEKIPMDDEKTMELFQTGQTDDVFQFSDEGMQKILPILHPTCFEDLVILNSMYRPGPMKFIATLVKQKNSSQAKRTKETITKKAVKYMIPCMEKYLHNTYGIIVYQEQIMMLSQLIANFDRSESDLLRKALGKRKMDVLSVLKPRFIEGGIKNGHKKNALEKVWNEMEAKGMYAFQKSHAVCYTWLAYQMAYLKANYQKEFKQVIEKYNSD